VTITACVAALALMVVRFDYSPEKLLQVFWICLILLLAILAVALPAALLLRLLGRRNDDLQWRAEKSKMENQRTGAKETENINHGSQ